MSLMKRCQEHLITGTDTEKYQICRFLVKTSVRYQSFTDLKQKKDYYEQKIHYYADKYSLSRSKLGKIVAAGEL